MSAAAQGRILVVDDEVHLAAGIRENLAAEGYVAEAAHDGAEGVRKALASAFDLIVLDVNMPVMDGLAACRALRAQGRQTPVLFLTVRGDPADRIRGLEAGGDDYLAKPFHLRELLLRIAAILRRSAWYGAAGEPLAFGGNEVDFGTYRARAWDGADHALTHKEAMILKVLADRAGQVVGREEILERVWGVEVYPATRAIEDLVERLRQRFERDADSPRHLHTVRGVGYRFTGQPSLASASAEGVADG